MSERDEIKKYVDFHAGPGAFQDCMAEMNAMKALVETYNPATLIACAMLSLRGALPVQVDTLREHGHHELAELLEQLGTALMRAMFDTAELLAKDKLKQHKEKP